MSQRSHYEAYMAYRPPHIDSRHPLYAPERDIAQISRWLRVMVRFIRTPELWERCRWALKMISADDAESQERLNRCHIAMIQFMEDARGAFILDKGDREDYDTLPDFEESLKRFLSVDPEMSLVYLSEFGRQAMDALFFACRQDSLLGQDGHIALSNTIAEAQRYGQFLQSGKPSFVISAELLRDAVRQGLISGLTPGQITAMVTESLNSEMSKLGPVS